MKMRHLLLPTLALMAPSAFAATTFTPIVGYDPTTYWNTAPTAGFDFNGQNGPNQSGFTAIAPDNALSYSAVSNGVTLDLTLTNVNLFDHRNRNNANAGNLVMDFAQWHNNIAGVDAEAAFSFSGLTPNTDYDISFFVYNVGSGQMTHSFYEGTSSSDPLITTFTTAGNQNTYSTWSPGITFRINSGASGQIDVTMQDAGSRINMNGISLVQIPEPSTTLLGALGMIALLRRRK